MIKRSITYIISNIIEAGLAFLLLPILTHFLSDVEYGLTNIYLTYFKFLAPIIGLNLYTSFSIEYFKRKEQELSIYNQNILIIVLFNTIIAISLFFMLDSLKIINLPKNHIFLFLPFLIFSQHLPNTYLALCQSKEKSKVFMLYKNLNSLLNYLIIFLIVSNSKYLVESQFIGLIIGNSIFSFIAYFIMFHKKIEFKNFNINDIKFGYNFGFTILLYSISGLIMSILDRLIIEKYHGLAEVGFYSVAYQFGTLITILSTGINRSTTPLIFKYLEKKDNASRQKVIKYLYVASGIIFISSIFLIIFSDLFFYFFIDQKFYPSKKFIIPLVLGLMFQGGYMMISSLFFYFKKNRILSYISLISAIINILLNIIFIPKYGAMGAAYSTLITYFSLWIFIIYSSSKHLSLSLNIINKND